MDWFLNQSNTILLAWGLLVGIALTVEVRALKNTKRGDTWSEVLRYIFGFSKRSPLRGWANTLARTLFYMLAAWFTYHIGR